MIEGTDPESVFPVIFYRTCATDPKHAHNLCHAGHSVINCNKISVEKMIDCEIVESGINGNIESKLSFEASMRGNVASINKMSHFTTGIDRQCRFGHGEWYRWN